MTFEYMSSLPEAGGMTQVSRKMTLDFGGDIRYGIPRSTEHS
jgi:hypothetical protein